jgi:hypothetical protein
MPIQTMPRHFWKHDVQVRAAARGVPAEWVRHHFGERLNIWYRLGETIDGAVDMLVFSHRQAAVAEGAELEANALRAILRAACLSE